MVGTASGFNFGTFLHNPMDIDKTEYASKQSASKCMLHKTECLVASHPSLVLLNLCNPLLVQMLILGKLIVANYPGLTGETPCFLSLPPVYSIAIEFPGFFLELLHKPT